MSAAIAVAATGTVAHELSEDEALVFAELVISTGAPSVALARAFLRMHAELERLRHANKGES